MVWFYKHSNNETSADIFMFPFFFGGGGRGGGAVEFLCFIFIAEKDKSKVLKIDMMYFSYLEISVALF